MTQLITLRQRIKTIETIKKTTNAMRLIAMSAHARLKQHKGQLHAYEQALTHLIQKVSPTWPLLEDHHSSHSLIIAIGSHKGLCGNFNTTLLKEFLHSRPPYQHTTIIIGKQLHDLCSLNKIHFDSYYENLSLATYHHIAHELADTIIRHNYQSVLLVTQEAKTFFTQKPRTVAVWPLTSPEPTTITEPRAIEGSHEKLFHKLVRSYLVTHITKILFESLYAEQAARFLTMDTATRNAENLLTSMKLEYNKLRQAIITRELTDLTSSL